MCNLVHREGGLKKRNWGYKNVIESIWRRAEEHWFRWERNVFQHKDGVHLHPNLKQHVVTVLLTVTSTKSGSTYLFSITLYWSRLRRGYGEEHSHQDECFAEVLRFLNQMGSRVYACAWSSNAGTIPSFGQTITHVWYEGLWTYLSQGENWNGVYHAQFLPGTEHFEAVSWLAMKYLGCTGGKKRCIHPCFFGNEQSVVCIEYIPRHSTYSL